MTPQRGASGVDRVPFDSWPLASVVARTGIACHRPVKNRTTRIPTPTRGDCRAGRGLSLTSLLSPAICELEMSGRPHISSLTTCNAVDRRSGRSSPSGRPATATRRIKAPRPLPAIRSTSAFNISSQRASSTPATCWSIPPFRLIESTSNGSGPGVRSVSSRRRIATRRIPRGPCRRFASPIPASVTSRPRGSMITRCTSRSRSCMGTSPGLIGIRLTFIAIPPRWPKLVKGWRRASRPSASSNFSFTASGTI